MDEELIKELNQEIHNNNMIIIDNYHKVHVIKDMLLEQDNFRTAATFIPIASFSMIAYLVSGNLIERTNSILKNIPSDIFPLFIFGSSYLLSRLIVKTSDKLSKREEKYKKISNSKKEKDKVLEIINYEIESEYLKAKNEILEIRKEHPSNNYNNTLINPINNLDKEYKELKELITKKVIVNHILKSKENKLPEITMALSLSLGTYNISNHLSSFHDSLGSKGLFDYKIVNCITLVLMEIIANYRIINKNRIDKKIAKPYQKYKNTFDILDLEDEIENKIREILQHYYRDTCFIKLH